MALGVLSGFNPTLLTTTAKTLIGTAGPCYVTARLVNATTACTLIIYDTNNTTAAASRVAILKTFGRGADELGAPIRCQTGVTVKMSVNTGTAFIYVR
jgi:hypothetical protein